MSFSNFIIRWLMISFYCSNIIIIFISKGFWPSVPPSSISLLEDKDDDQLHGTIFKTARRSKLFFEIVLYRKSSGILGKIRLDSLVHLLLADLSMRIHDHWSHCPDNNEEGKFSAVCPADGDCPVWQIARFIPWANMRKCLPLLLYFDVIQVWILRVVSTNVFILPVKILPVK